MQHWARLFAAPALALLLTAGVARAQQDLKAKVDKALEPLQKHGKFAQVVGILIGGEQHVFAYGTLAVDTSRPVDGDTLFEIGSCTKTFTALALAGMVQDKIVKYDDPVRLCLAPGWKVPTRGGKEITLEHLATHMSGLPVVPPELALCALFDPDPYPKFTPKLLREFLGRYELPRDIGSKYEYSNLGVGLLGYALARKAGRSYEQLIQDRICKPLGMRDTCITPSQEQQKRTAQGYSEEDEPAPPERDNTLAGCGSLHSSMNDLLRYTAAQLDPGRTTLEAPIRDSQGIRVRKTEIPHHALAMNWLAILTQEGKPRVYWHNGETNGFEAFIGFCQDRRVGVVLLSNRSPDLAEQGATAAGLKLLVELAREQAETAASQPQSPATPPPHASPQPPPPPPAPTSAAATGR